MSVEIFFDFFIGERLKESLRLFGGVAINMQICYDGQGKTIHFNEEKDRVEKWRRIRISKV